MSSLAARCCWLAAPLRPTPTRILRKRADKAVLGETAAYTLRMTVQPPGKADRVVEMKGWKKGDDKGLVRYTVAAQGARHRLPAQRRQHLALPARRPRRWCASAPSRTSAAATSATATSSGSRSCRDYVPDPGRRGDGGRPGLLEARAQGAGPLGGLRPRACYWVRQRRHLLPGARRVLHDLRPQAEVADAVRRGEARRRARGPTLLTMENALEAGRAHRAALPGHRRRRAAGRPHLHAERAGERASEARAALAWRCSVLAAAAPAAGARDRAGLRELLLPHRGDAAQPRQRAGARAADEDLLRGTLRWRETCPGGLRVGVPRLRGARGWDRAATPTGRRDRPTCSTASGDVVTLRVGKQRIAWGSGFAWNPTNRMEPPKNPLNPALEQQGVAGRARIDVVPAPVGGRHPGRGAARRRRRRPALRAAARRARRTRRRARALPGARHGPGAGALGRPATSRTLVGLDLGRTVGPGRRCTPRPPPTAARRWRRAREDQRFLRVVAGALLDARRAPRALRRVLLQRRGLRRRAERSAWRWTALPQPPRRDLPPVP